MRKKICVCLLAMMILTIGISMPIKAQNKQGKLIKSHAGVGLRGGLGGLRVEPKQGVALGFSIGAEAEYNYLLTEHFGIKAGIGFSHTNATLEAEDVRSNVTKMTSMNTSTANRQVNAQYQLLTYTVEETYTMNFVEIPLLLVLQGTSMDFSLERFHNCYFALGARVAIPISCNVSTDFSRTKVWMGPEVPGINQAIDEGVKMPDYYPEGVSYALAEAGNPLYIMAAVEAGITIKFNEGGELILALFADYALNGGDTSNDPDQSCITSTGTAFESNGFLLSNRVEKFRFFKFGLKAQYNFNW
ncbi:MAG: outer membrane beta-barrel protein [Bacteroidales bacterium]|nr:outer membrane beta-barrel protein [Bacteroidales bacterium]